MWNKFLNWFGLGKNKKTSLPDFKYTPEPPKQRPLTEGRYKTNVRQNYSHTSKPLPPPPPTTTLRYKEEDDNDVVDDIIDVGIGMAVASIFSSSNDDSSSSDSDDSFGGFGGGSFGGGGASDEW